MTQDNNSTDRNRRFWYLFTDSHFHFLHIFLLLELVSGQTEGIYRTNVIIYILCYLFFLLTLIWFEGVRWHFLLINSGLLVGLSVESKPHSTIATIFLAPDNIFMSVDHLSNFGQSPPCTTTLGCMPIVVFILSSLLFSHSHLMKATYRPGIAKLAMKFLISKVTSCSFHLRQTVYHYL